ncbi:CPSF A subunit region-domain-containing protein [Gorgonomyces haynaldii]|nr:CPSF A subunit region-domain-containing protein [Gorgonomyces haynaldii]
MDGSIVCGNASRPFVGDAVKILQDQVLCLGNPSKIFRIPDLQELKTLQLNDGQLTAIDSGWVIVHKDEITHLTLDYRATVYHVGVISCFNQDKSDLILGLRDGTLYLFNGALLQLGSTGRPISSIEIERTPDLKLTLECFGCDGFQVLVRNNTILELPDKIKSSTPVHDCLLADYNSMNQDTLFLSCGSSPYGRIKKIVHAIEPRALVCESMQCQRLWLNSMFLILSFGSETRVYSIWETEEIVLQDASQDLGFDLNQSTLEAHYLSSLDLHIQVLPSKIVLAKQRMMELEDPIVKEYLFEGKVYHSCAIDNKILLVLYPSSELVFLSISMQDQFLQVKQEKSCTLGHQVTCLYAHSSFYIACDYNHTMHIYDPSLERVEQLSLYSIDPKSPPIINKCAVLGSFLILVSRQGHLITFPVNEWTKMQVYYISDGPLDLGQQSKPDEILLLSKHPRRLTIKDGHLQIELVLSDALIAASTFVSSLDYTFCLTRSTLQVLVLGQTPKHMIYDPKTRLLLVALEKQNGTLIQGIDPSTHQVVLKMQLEDTVLWNVKESKRYIVFGTQFEQQGRLLVYSLKPSTKKMHLHQVGHLETSKPVNAVTELLSSYLVIAIGSDLHQVKIEGQNRRLVFGLHTHARFPIKRLDTKDDLIYCAGHQDSVIVYRFDKQNKKIHFVKSDEFVRWTLDQMLVDDAVLASDTRGCLFLLENSMMTDVHSLATSSLVQLPEPCIRLLRGRMFQQLQDYATKQDQIIGITLNGDIVQIFLQDCKPQMLLLSVLQEMHLAFPPRT